MLINRNSRTGQQQFSGPVWRPDNNLGIGGASFKNFCPIIGGTGLSEHLKNPSYNPMPGDPTSGFVEAGEGISLRYAHWRLSPITRKGTVIILQGRSEYIEKQYELTADLLEEGYDVLNFDWRGQGGIQPSSRRQAGRIRG